MTRRLRIEKAVWQYWQLLHAMLFNLKTIGYVLVFFFGCTLIALGLGIAFRKSMPIALVLVYLSSAIFFVMGLLGLPIGMYVLASNRHISLIADVRNKLFNMGIIFSVLFSIAVSLFVINTPQTDFHLSHTLFCFFVCALYFWLMIYIASKNVGLALLTPIFFIAGLKFSSNLFTETIPIALAATGGVAWWLFYRWWMTFIPDRRATTFVFLQVDRHKLQELPFEKWIIFSSNKVKTPLGTVLLGYGDGLSAFVKRLAATYSICLLLSFYVFGGFKGGITQEQLIIAVLIASAYTLIMMNMESYNKKILINFKRTWLIFSGNRMDFFIYVESFVWRSLGFLLILNFLCLSVFLFVISGVQYIFYVACALIIVGLILVINFYWDIYSHESKREATDIDIRKALTNAVVLLLTIYYLVEKFQHLTVFDVKDAIAGLLVIVAIGSLKFLRFQALKKWILTDI